jgi:hypothetical protein
MRRKSRRETFNVNRRCTRERAWAEAYLAERSSPHGHAAHASVFESAIYGIALKNKPVPRYFCFVEKY